VRGRLAAVLAFALCLPPLAALSADAAVYIVRHAEKKDPKKDRSLLSKKGKARAEALKKVLADIDLKAVYCTEYERTQQTAAPTAQAKKLKPTVMDSEDIAGLVKTLKALPAEQDVLVVGHTDTIPDILKGLGVETPIEIREGDFDNLFQVALREGKPPAFARLHY
jgi:2,3-bisphosphoglycerate-dependent phosphoglycerate mutase